MRFSCVLLTLSFLAAAGAGLAQPPEEAAPLPPVRVQLTSLGAPRRITVKAAALRITGPGSEEDLAAGPGPVALEASGDMIEIGGRKVAAARVEAALVSVTAGKTTRSYPGAVVLTANAGRLAPVNECSLEEYAAGVLCGECPALFHPEAIGATAVAVRSYSYRRAYLGKVPLCDTTHCQVYLGTGNVRDTIWEAVRATAGIFALHEGRPIDAVYSSDCGGSTEANEVVWKGSKPLPYLRVVEDAPEPEGEPYCTVNRSHGWKLALSDARLQALYGKPAAGLKLTVTEVTESGRARRVQLGPAAGENDKGAAPETKVFSGEELRRRLGADAAKSLRFEVRETESGVELVGTGWGHGVGLCQFGANGMAKQGATHEEIVRHYYTGVELGPAPPVSEVRARTSPVRMGRAGS